MCHTPVEEMKEISDINMVLLKRMLCLLLLLLLLTPPVVLLQNLVLVLIVLHTVVISIPLVTQSRPLTDLQEVDTEPFDS